MCLAYKYINCHMSRNNSGGSATLNVVDWVSWLITEQVLYLPSDMCILFKYLDPIWYWIQSALHSRYRESPDEPITARTNIYMCLCMQETNIDNIPHLPDQVQGQVARLATQTPGWMPDLGPLTEGPGPTSSPGSLPAPRVACRCLPVGFDRQQAPWQILDAHLFIRFPSTEKEFWNGTGAIGSSMRF
jgi:hypothetical protein